MCAPVSQHNGHFMFTQLTLMSVNRMETSSCMVARSITSRRDSCGPSPSMESLLLGGRVQQDS